MGDLGPHLHPDFLTIAIFQARVAFSIITLNWRISAFEQRMGTWFH
jgi:hypothetical protein